MPVQVLLGVLGQESNLWQAKRHVMPGQTGNPLVGNYYGVDYYNDTGADDWNINWADPCRGTARRAMAAGGYGRAGRSVGRDRVVVPR
ncbi:hypothetical protein LFM09_10085 [Lentzea alba]|uniref:hypothetical protein n=1 Tax=Lentzea alba TaxID=2714351 RepID=UPI0039BFAF6C